MGTSFQTRFTQIEMMRQGGNTQIMRFFQKIEIENSPIQTLYCTKAARHYRERLRDRVDKILSGEIKSERRVVSSSPKRPAAIVPAKDASMCLPTNIKNEFLKVVFGEGAMGLTLTKDTKEMALVSKLIPGGEVFVDVFHTCMTSHTIKGAAQLNGVKIGDRIVGVAGKAMDNYEEIMHMIPCMNRPLEIQFSRIVRIADANKAELNGSKIHESRSESNLVWSKGGAPLTSQSSKLPSPRKSAEDSSSGRVPLGIAVSESAKVIPRQDVLFVKGSHPPHRSNTKKSSHEEDDGSDDEGILPNSMLSQNNLQNHHNLRNFLQQSSSPREDIRIQTDPSFQRFTNVVRSCSPVTAASTASADIASPPFCEDNNRSGSSIAREEWGGRASRASDLSPISSPNNRKSDNEARDANPSAGEDYQEYSSDRVNENGDQDQDQANSSSSQTALFSLEVKR